MVTFENETVRGNSFLGFEIAFWDGNYSASLTLGIYGALSVVPDGIST